MLSIHYSRENAEQRTAFASTAAIVAGTGAVAGAVAASATWTQPPPLSLGTPRRPPSPSVGIAPSTRPSATSAAPTVLYQSEHRSLGQRSIAPTGSATSWSQAPGVASSPGGSAAGDGWDDGDGLPATMAEEGVVHFSLPARVSRGVGGGQMEEEEEDGAGMFTVALWQVFNRSRRVRLSSVLRAVCVLSSSMQDLALFLIEKNKDCTLFRTSRGLALSKKSEQGRSH